LSASEFVKQYADNLLRGGLFVRNAESLQPMEDVSIDLYLPGFRCFRLNARVTHVVSEEQSEAYGSPVGAGLELVSPSPKFKDSLLVYLQRVGQRSESMVLLAGVDCKGLLDSAGYLSELTNEQDVLAQIAVHGDKFLAVVIDGASYGAFESLLKGTPAEGKLVLFSKTDAERVLTDLDGHLS
jgi:hypothetical protein